MNGRANWRVRFGFLSIVFGLLVSSCDSGVVYTDLRVYSSPYGGIDWANVQRLKTQHHDHVAANISRIRAYDSAGYDGLSLMDYSGSPTLPYALKHRLWPPDQWISPSNLTSLARIRFFIPNAEEVGINQHATSPFLTSYIEATSPLDISNPTTQYGSMSDMFELIRANSGFPCFAHAWNYDIGQLNGKFCTEIFTAFAEAKKYLGEGDFLIVDHNERLLTIWDSALARNQQVFGIAVNDHFGPYNLTVAPEVRDSGKILVLADEATLDSYREAFEAGRIFAVRDSNEIKDQYPEIYGISVDEDGLTIDTNGIVFWVSHGVTIAQGPVLSRSELPPNSTYVRAEVAGTVGHSVVYTQAFVIRPVGDSDGDYDVDEQDDRICERVAQGSESNVLYIEACRSRDTP